MNTREQLMALAESGRYCAVKRSFTEDARHVGYIVCVGTEHFAMEQFDDFCSDGVSVFPIEHVIEISTSERDDFFHRVIENEHLHCQLPPLVSLTSFIALLRWAQEQGELLIVEEESVFAEESDYSLGRVMAVSEIGIELAYLDSKGHWDAGIVEIELEEITRLQVFTPYCAMFARHCDPFVAPGGQLQCL